MRGLRCLGTTLLIFIVVLTPTSLLLSGLCSCVVREANLHLLAVSSSGGSYTGVTTLLKVSLIPGDGSVYLSIDPLSELDMQSSLKVASLVAGFVSGVDLSNYSVLVKIQSDTPIVGGPSAGAALTAVLTALLTNTPLSNSTVVTGMIMPDTLIGPVGGIPEKLEAAASVGAKLMIIPAGQRMSTSLKTGTSVDVVERGKKFGVTVVEASTIYDVLNYFGIPVGLPVVDNVNLSANVLKTFKTVAEEYMSEYGELYSNVSDAVSVYGRRLANSFVLSDVRGFLSNSASEAKRGEEMYGVGNYYAAASDYFGALVYVWTAKLLVDMVVRDVNWPDVLELVGGEVSNATGYFNRLMSSIEASRLDISRLGVLVEIASRVYESNYSLTQLRALRGATVNAVYQAAYTYMRARSVFGWGLIYDVLGECGVSIPVESLESGTQALLSFSRASITYLQSLAGSVSGVSELFSYLNSAETLLSRGGLGNVLMSLGLAFKASSYAAVETHLSFESNVTSLISRLTNAARGYVGLAKSLGVEPVVSLIYLERGSSLAGVDDESAANFLDQAILNTIWFLILAKAGKAEVTHSNTPNATPTVTPTSKGSDGGAGDTDASEWVYLVAVAAVSAISGALLGYLSGSRRKASASEMW
ncbi:MAG: S16 family serine protease [Zestosphaera sp.]